MRIEAEPDRPGIGETLQHQSGGAEEHERECDLRDHKQIARAARTRSVRAAVSAGFKSELDIGARGVPRRPETEQNAGDKREREAEHEHPPAQRDILETRNARRRQRNEDVASPGRQTKSEPAADQREDDALDQKLPDDLPARRSHRSTHREFTRSRGTTRRQQIGEIRAGNEENERHRAEQKSQARTVITHLIFQQRSHRHTHAGVGIRILFRKPRRDLFQIGQRFLDRHARPQAPPPVQARMIIASLPVRIVGAPHQGEPDLDCARRKHLRRHHADNGVRLVAEVQRAPEHMRIARKESLP